MRSRSDPWFKLGDPHAVDLAKFDVRLFEFTATQTRDIMGYFDKRQRPLSLYRWAKHMEDPVYCRVAITHLPQDFWVSTVWIGVARLAYSEEPLIFETAAFEPNPNTHAGFARFDEAHYATERDALAGHERMVTRLREQLAKVS